MPDWIETLFGIVAQFTGGREPAGPSIVWYGIAAVAWGLLAYAAAAKGRRENSPREWLLLIAFLFGFGREVLMIVVNVLEALGAIGAGVGHAFLLPSERALQNVAMVLIAAAFMGFVTNRREPTKQYLKAALAVVALCYVASLVWWAGDDQTRSAIAWSEWLSHIAMSLLLAFPIVFLCQRSSGWTRLVVSAALGCFWLFEFLKIPDMGTNETYTMFYTPIRHGLYLLGIPLLGYVFLREALDELVHRRVALQASELRMRGLLDHLDVVVGEWELPTLKLRFISKQAEKLFGYPIEKWESLCFWEQELIHPDDRDWVPGFCKDETKAGNDHDFEYRVITGNGEVRWIHEYVQIVRESDAEPERLVCVMVDVTKDKKAEIALREESDFAKGLVDTAQAIILVLDSNGRIVMCNPYLEELTGRKLDEVRGKDWFDTFLPGRDHERIRERFKTAISVKPTHGEINPILTKAGEEREISWWDKELLNADGDLIGLLCIGYDVTDRLQMEKALQRSNEELDRRVRERTRELEEAQEELVRKDRLATLGQLAGGVAHEMRNPLAVIRNNVYYFEATQEEAGEDTKAAFEEIYRAMNDSEHIVQELLDFARDPKPNENSFMLASALDEAMRGVEVPSTVQLNQSHEDVEVSCCGDQGQVARILGNLIRNAIDEMAEGGTLTIDTQLHDDSVTVMVADTGNGIAPENLDRVFEPLHTRKAKGIGLGLAISKRYADLNAASLSVTSTMGNGARFELVLKRSDPI